jgi:small-conductance mechanosensitive channel
MDLLLRERSNDLLSLADDANKMLGDARSLAIQYNRSLQETDASLGNFLSLYQISKGHPMEQDDILKQLHGLRNHLVRSMSPLEDVSSVLAQRREDLAAMRTSLSETPGDAYAANLRLATERLSQAAAGVEAMLGPGKSLLKRLEDAIGRISSDLPATWSDYYFTESRVLSTKLSATFQGSDSIFRWFSQLYNRRLFIYPQSGGDWVQSLLSFLLTAAITAFVGLLLYRSAQKLPSDWELSIHKIARGPWLYLALGLALVNASSTSLGGSYLLFLYPGILLLIWGVAGLSWRLRIAAKPSLAGNVSPLSRFFVPAALGVTLLFADVPAGVTSVLWFFIMIVFLVKLRSIGRKSREPRPAEGSFLLERFAYSSAFYFSVLSLICAVAGFPRLAVLVFMLLFALANILILGNALMHLGSVLCQKVFNQDTDPVKHAILNAVVVPASFVAALLSALPWIKAVPGSNYLIQNYLHKGYSVGAASFDLTKILLIAALFFLFRSLKVLGTTSLQHLPDKVPLESGVVQPLQMLLTYLIWIAYALIVLMILGVNFTSLAVVAGGLSVGIGFGLQNIFNNLVSGVMLIFGRSILVGDFVEVGGAVGTVKSVSIRCTVIETAANAAVFVPNSTIMSGQFINWTRNGRQARKNVTVSVQYGTDTALVVKLLSEAAKGDPRIAAYPEPAAVLDEFGEKCLKFSLYVTVLDVDLAAGALSDLRLKVESLFKENDVKLTVPPIDLNISRKEATEEAALAAPAAPKALEPVKER